jgi:chromosome segregation ATPase
MTKNEPKKRKPSSPPKRTEESDSEGDELTLADLMKELKAQRTDLSTLSSAYVNQTESLEKINNLLASHQEDIKELKTETKSIRSDLELVNIELNEAKQQLLANNMVVSGPPILPEQSSFDYVKSIVSLMDENLEEVDIADLYRIRRKNGDAVVVKFVSTQTKLKLMDQLKQHSKDAQPNTPKAALKKVFFSDQLTPYNEALWHKIRVLKKKANYAFAWTKQGKFYLKTTETGGRIRIRVIDDLKDMYKEHKLEL